ncbi:MAG: DNA polymerase III subunit delta [Clostridiales bacterium]|nr:DNA polymerase III subunit delta [Clostridiales bacterium]
MALEYKNDSDAAAAFEKFKKEVKNGKPARMYIICGKESYLKEYWLIELRKTLLDGVFDEFNHRRLDGEQLDIRKLEEAVESLPSFAPFTLVEVRDYDLFKCIDEDASRLIALISDLPEWCCLVFYYESMDFKTDKRRKKLYAALEAAGPVIRIDEQGRGQLIRWIQRRFEAYGHDISDSNADYLSFLCGGLMTNLLSEIEKISSYSSTKSITREGIDAVAVPVLDAAVFSLTDSLAAHNYPKAVSVLSELFLMKRDNPSQILAAVAAQFRRLYAAKIAKRLNRDTAFLKKVVSSNSDYYARKLLSSCISMGEAYLASAIRLCAETDLQLKSTTVGSEDLIITLLVKLALRE